MINTVMQLRTLLCSIDRMADAFFHILGVDEEKGSFGIGDLPDCYRIIKWGCGERLDCNEDRLRVYLDARGVVTEVIFR